VSLCGAQYEPFKGLYFIGNDGSIRRASRAVRIGTSEAFRKVPETTSFGVVNTCLYPNTKLHCNGIKKTVMLHRLVAIAFVENPNNYEEVNHIDGNKQNNRHTNLEWVTRSQNQKHAYATGLQVAKPANVKVTEDAHAFIKTFASEIGVTEMAARLGVHQSTIRRHLKE